MKKLPVHPALAGFPEQPEPIVAALALDVKKHGLVNPIVLFEEQILDGRARLVACDRAGVEPTFHTYTGDDPVAFVVAANAGRQMTPGQRALAAARASRAWKARRVQADTSEVQACTWTGDASDRAAQAFGVSRRTVFSAEKLLGDDELSRAVEAGRLKVNEALRRLAPTSKTTQPTKTKSDRTRAAEAVDRVERKALALRDELREVCEMPEARLLIGDLLRDLSTEFYNLAEGKEEGAAAQ